MKTRFGLLVGMTAVLCAGGALALDAEAQIKVRQDYFKAIGHTMKGMIDEIKKPDPAMAELQKDALFLQTEAPKLTTYFPAGTGLDKGFKTGAKPEIWTNAAEFKKDADALAAATQKLNAVAQTGDVAAFRTAVGGVGQACKTCHQSFRKEEH